MTDSPSGASPEKRGGRWRLGRWEGGSLRSDLRELVVDGKVVAVIEQYRPPNNSHMSIWSARVGDWRSGGCDTLKNAKVMVMRRLGIARWKAERDDPNGESAALVVCGDALVAALEECRIARTNLIRQLRGVRWKHQREDERRDVDKAVPDEAASRQGKYTQPHAATADHERDGIPSLAADPTSGASPVPPLEALMAHDPGCASLVPIWTVAMFEAAERYGPCNCTREARLRAALAELLEKNKTLSTGPDPMRTRADYDLRCDRCHAPHNLDTSIPSDAWNAIAPSGGVLCTLCIDELLTANGLRVEAEFYFAGASLTSRLYQAGYGEMQELRRQLTDALERIRLLDEENKALTEFVRHARRLAERMRNVIKTSGEHGVPLALGEIEQLGRALPWEASQESSGSSNTGEGSKT